MRRIGRGLLGVAAAAALAACASLAPPGPTATTSTSVGASVTGVAASNTESAVPNGYRRVVKKDTEYFCRTEAVTGSHTLKNEVCLTKDELDAERNHRVTAGLNPPAPGQGGAADAMPSR
jgi:hypothetical protein